jgi:hypothetical protein
LQFLENFKISDRIYDIKENDLPKAAIQQNDQLFLKNDFKVKFGF